MVLALHAAGIEVILDVVYNHTAEGNHQGPTVSMRGIDNAAYYRLVEDDEQFYMDYTGTGNSLNVGHPHTLQLIMDSLRYWVTEMHVDGFRFDLAATLAREFYEVDRLSAFFELVQQDPIVSQVKLIAEPWDLGPGGYQVGNFPPQWTEWNGQYRDTVRDFWRGEPATLGEFASRITGSSDLYEDTGRRPVASINFVTAHDGFTLRDLVSYNEKHNEANGEGGNDGSDDNRSFNMGVEGETDDATVLMLRARQQRNFLGDAAALAGRADDRARRRARAHAARQQQRVRAGLRDRLGALGPGRPAPDRVHGGGDPAATRPPDVPAQPLLRRAPGAARRGRAAARPGVAAAGRHGDAARGLGGRVRPHDRRVPQRPGHPRRHGPRRADRRPALPGLLQRAHRGRRHPDPDRGALAAPGISSSTPTAASRRRADRAGRDLLARRPRPRGAARARRRRPADDSVTAKRTPRGRTRRPSR